MLDHYLQDKETCIQNPGLFYDCLDVYCLSVLLPCETACCVDAV